MKKVYDAIIIDYKVLRDRIYEHPTMTESLNEVLSDKMIKEI
jgi:probable pyridine nucleotide-disulfide oxidoreductase